MQEISDRPNKEIITSTLHGQYIKLYGISILTFYFINNSDAYTFAERIAY